MKARKVTLTALAFAAVVASGPALAGAPVFVDDKGTAISEDASEIYHLRWSKVSAFVEDGPGGDEFQVDVALYKNELGIYSEIDNIKIYKSNRIIDTVTRRELTGIVNPKLARMRIRTYGTGKKNIILDIPVDAQCPGFAREDTGVGYIPDSVDDPRGDDVYYDGVAIISIQRFLDKPNEFRHNISIYNCRRNPESLTVGGKAK